MNAFEHFQHATVLIAAGDRAGAKRALCKAVKHIDRTGIDAHLRDDLLALLAAM